MAFAMPLLWQAAPALAQPVPRTGEIAGQIVARKAGEQARLLPATQFRDATVRQQLKAGDVLRTNATGTLGIVFADRTQVRLARNSTLLVRAVQDGRPSAVQLQRGKLWGRAPRGRSNISIETPSATAAIRGTEFALEVSDEQTLLSVFEGSVEIANEAGGLTVGAGEAARVQLGQAPVRVALIDPVGREQQLYFVTLEEGRDFAARAPGDAAASARLFDALAAGESPDLPQGPNQAVTRAFILAYQGSLSEAMVEVDSALAQTPGDAALLTLKVRIALLLGDGALAAQTIEKVLAANPDDPVALAQRAEIRLLYEGQPYLAWQDAERAVAIDPKRALSYATLADILLERGALREAVQALQAGLAISPNNPALLARLASARLGQNRLADAEAANARALEIDPSLEVVRATNADIALRRGQPELAAQEALAASAASPGYARALLRLAEAEYRQGRTAVALQQLDAADRLDPDSPVIALARTAIAIHRFDGDGAITGAREATRRFQARGGVYSNLSENRETGSLVSQAFRFLNLEGWGRYYADRVFDSFTPTSYFDQAVNLTPNPFVTTYLGPGFNPERGDNLQQISSFLQGLTFDPLNAAYSVQRLQFSNEVFGEQTLGVEARSQPFSTIPRIFAQADGLVQAPLPIGYSLRLSTSNVLATSGVDRDDDRTFNMTLWGGTELTPDDRLTTFVRGRRLRVQSQADPAFPTARDSKDNGDAIEAFGFYTHSFGYRNVLTMGGGLGRDSLRSRFDPLPPELATDFARSLRLLDQDNDFEFGSISYARGIGRLDLEIGAEAVWRRITNRLVDDLFLQIFQFDPTLPDPFIPVPGAFDVFVNDDRTETREQQQRFYVDARYVPLGPVMVQGQIAYVSSKLELIGNNPIRFGDFNQRNRDRIDYRIGAAWEPRAGQWLRLGYSSQTASVLPFTFAPLDSIGLRPNIAPSGFSVPYTSLMARWDSEWSSRFFTVVEFQHQEFPFLLIPEPTDQAATDAVGARIDRLSVSANLWLPGNFGLSANYAFTDSFGDRSSPGQILRGSLPYVPRHFGRGSLTWSHPARVRLSLTQSYLGDQTGIFGGPIRDFFSTDATLQWEPFDRHVIVRFDVVNLFDAKVRQQGFLPVGGRNVTASLAVRF